MERRRPAVHPRGGPHHVRTPSPELLIAAAGLALAASGTLAAVPAQAAGTPACTNADLHASYRGGDGAAGTVFGRIVLRNTSDHACHTGGYGGISYVGHGDGTQIGAPARRTDVSAVATLRAPARTAPAQPDRRDRGPQLPT